MRPPAFVRVMAFLLAGSLWAWPAGAAGDVLGDAEKLLQDGQAKQAYALLAPLEAERAGEPDYDFLLGLSALDSGEPGLAVFALERVVAVKPKFARARAELARAYFELRENEAAKREFETVKKQQPPPEVTATISRYLDALDARFKRLRGTRWTAYAELGLGYDSNVNSATDDSNVAIPALGNLVFTLSQTGVEQDDLFFVGEAGANVGRRLTDKWSVFAGARINERVNNNERRFDTGTIDLNAGAQYTRGNDAYSAAVTWNRFEVGNHLFRTVIGTNLQWRRTLNERNQVSAFAQLARPKYFPEAQSVRSTKLVLVGLGWAHAFPGRGAPTIFASVYAADESSKAAFPHLGRRYLGGRLGGQYSLRKDIDLFGAFNAQFSDYDGTEPLFLKSRDDDFYELTAGVKYRPFARWSINPQIRLSRNRSNIAIDDYSRVTAWATVRYDFN